MVGGQIIFLASEHKIIYHATTVFASNYLTAILELGQRCCRQAGMDETTARGLMEPLALETATNVFRLGPARALTGPIARGDSGLVADQLNALSTWQTETGEIYRLLGKVALELARQTKTACPRKLDMVAESLKKPTQS
jgi:predicted short-subunit dehydrogenase-like oxidoreductase (DUF2520 family)